MRKESLIFEMLQNAVMCIAISVSMAILTKTVYPLTNILISFIESFCINSILSIIFKIGKLGNAIANKLTQNNIIKYILSVAIITVIYVTIILFFMLVIKVGLSNELWKIFNKVYFYLLFVGVITAFITTPIIKAVTNIFNEKM